MSSLPHILQGLREVEGVQGAMVVGPTAAVIAHRAHSIYDLAVLQQVARSVVTSVDSVQRLHDDWDLMTAHFGDGKLLLRSLRVAGGVKPRRYILAVIADATLNIAFLGVALRVAVTKLLAELESAPAVGSTPIPIAGGPTARVSTADPARQAPVRTGLSWSGTSPAPGPGGSDVAVADSASATYLSACARALAASVGPMAKVFVKEAVRRVCGAQPFSRADGAALVAHLAEAIEDPDDRAAFRTATRTL
jgi:predicted regulator of Ras-like GTPase activity (Roadblock/LC7/MglB family)